MTHIDDSASKIRKLGEQINKFIICELNKKGLRGIVTSHGSILLQLFKHEQLQMGQMAELIGKDRSTVTTLISKLSSHGYVNISKDKTDKRLMLVSITPKGKKLEPIINQISKDLFSKMYSDISEKERDDFYNTLQKITSNF